MSVYEMEDHTIASSAAEAWEYSTWGDLIRDHIGRLNLNYDGNTSMRESSTQSYQPHVVLNAGLHPHDFLDPIVKDDIRFALRAAHLSGTWKTTTYSKEEVLTYQTSNQNPHVRLSDANMCNILGRCFNVSWTADIKAEELYYDNLHFSEPVYRTFNEDLLEQLGLLPKNYEKFDRSKVLRDFP